LPAKDASVVLLGAGGAARAVSHAVLNAGARRVVVANRTFARAERLGRELREIFPDAELQAIALENLRAQPLGDCDLLVNTTTVGMHEGQSPFDASLLPTTAAVVDIIYNPPETPLLRQAQERGLRTLNGLPMLVYQAAAAWEIWTGQSAPVDVMFEAARAALSPTLQPAAEAS
jgi:shikimate dehydrogenase